METHTTMASIETLLEQVAKSDLDITALLKLRSAVDDKLAVVRKDLERQLQALDGPAPRRGRPAGARRTRRNAANTPGKHQGMSVAEAVRKIISSKGGKLSTAQIKKYFSDAGDTRNLNFTILVRGGVLKKVGTESKKEGKKGRAGGIYAVAG
ncbi:MAG: hypothetical protein JNL80_17800 [Phycisphaerae bacterium]|nr:hypothetical protein [Phycisphaerae bacterium]